MEDFFMKIKVKNLIFTLVSVVVFIGLLFVPYVTISDEPKNAIASLFNGTFAWISIFSFLPFVLFLLGILFVALRQFKKGLSAVATILFMLSGFLFIFANSFIAYSLGLNESDISLNAGAIILSILSFGLALVSNGFIFDENRFSTRDIVESAMLVAFAVVLDLSIFKFKIVPNGGSISLAMLPLFIIALRQGPLKGFIVIGIVYGFINCLMDGYGFVYFPFDYLLGFGSLAILGLFRKWIFPTGKIGYTFKGVLFLVIGVLISGIARIVASGISGVVFFGLTPYDSLIYQLLYIPASVGLCLVALLVLYVPLQVINKRYPLIPNL